jgi:hypothetical protein
MEHFRAVRGAGLAASVLIGLVALGNFAEAGADWLTYATARDYRAGVATRADLDTLGVVRAITDLPLTMLSLVAIVVFIIWMYNARINAERLTYASEHRRSRVWVWLGWFVPVVNLWFPKNIIDDIWRASDPRLQGIPLQQRPSPRETTRWWTAYILMWFLDFAYFRVYQNGQLTIESYLTAAVLTTMCAVVGIIAAVLAVRVVRQISDFQSTPLSPLRTDITPA